MSSMNSMNRFKEHNVKIFDAILNDSHQHHFSETPVFVGRGVMAVGTNECVSTS